MKNIKTLILLLFELVLLNQLVSAQTRVVDNKGTVSTIDASKWVRIGTSNDIYAKYPGKVGIATSIPYATLHNAGSTILGMTTATDVAAAYTIPATFVDNYTGVLIKQTNNLSTITLPEPTNKTIGRLFTISNANESTYSLIIAGTTYTIPPTQSGQFVWNGINWSLPGSFASSALPIAGDVTATLGASVVSRINGSPLGTTTGAATGNVLAWDGSAWTKASPTLPFSGFTAALANNTVNNSTWAQTWNWTSTTQDPLTINANALTSGRALTIASTGAGNLTTGSLLRVSGQVASTTITNGLFTVNNTGASTTGIVATIKANSTTPGLTVRANGNVGIGTDAPASTLEVSGAATNKEAYDAGGSTTIDFSKSNIAYTTAPDTGITLDNLKDGGAYTLIIKPGGTTAVVFTATGFSFVYMGTTVRTTGRTHIYSFIVADTTVYVTMATSNT